MPLDRDLRSRRPWRLEIAEVNNQVLERYEPSADSTVDDIIAADARARIVAQEVLPA